MASRQHQMLFNQKRSDDPDIDGDFKSSYDFQFLEEAIRQADILIEEERLLEAARILNSIDVECLLDDHKNIISKAKDISEFLEDINSTINMDDQRSSQDFNEDFENSSYVNRWVEQKIDCGKRSGTIFYKLNSDGVLTLKIETPIEKTLLIPLLSVLNESELYPSWIPNWTIPHFSITRSIKLQQRGRASQTLLVTCEVPWPLLTREVVISADAVDDIEGHSENIIVRLKTLTHTEDNKKIVPPPESEKICRISFTGGFTFQKPRKSEKDEDHDVKESFIISSFLARVDSKLLSFPKPLLDFVLKHAFGLVWKKLLSVAEEVRDGERPLHQKVIESKRASLYDWLDERINRMLQLNQGKTVTNNDQL